MSCYVGLSNPVTIGAPGGQNASTLGFVSGTTLGFVSGTTVVSRSGNRANPPVTA